MAAGQHTTKGTRRIRFTSNVSVEGVDYGPDYDEADVEMAPNEAFRFVHEGRAVYVDDGPTTAVNDDTQAHVASRKRGGRK